jgi:hypothetical protein
MLQIILVGLVAFVAYVAYNHIASQPGSVQKGTYTDKLNDPEASCPPLSRPRRRHARRTSMHSGFSRKCRVTRRKQKEQHLAHTVMSASCGSASCAMAIEGGKVQLLFFSLCRLCRHCPHLHRLLPPE